MEDAVRLLRALRSLDTDALGALLHARHVPQRGITDLLDLAEWLTAPQQTRQALQDLGWQQLHRLRLAEPAAVHRAERLGLAEGGHVLPGAATTLEELLGADGPATPPAPVAPGQRAHATAVLLRDLLWELDRFPRAGRDGRGGPRLAGTELRRIAGDLGRSTELVEIISRSAFRAGLAGPADTLWAPTARGRALLAEPTLAGWRALAGAWLQALGPDERRRLHGGQAPPDVFAGELEVTAAGTLTDLGAVLIEDRLDEAVRLLAGRFPAEVEHGYVQPDLTIVVPGPPTPQLDSTLRRLTDLETRGTASTYRLSSASLHRALTAGLDIERQLATTSLTPLPQPVRYLLAEAAAKYDRIRVAPDGGGAAGSRVNSEDAQQLERIRVDLTLAPLSLRPAERGLRTPLAPWHVQAALTEAGYPAVLDDGHGRRLQASPPTAGRYREPVPSGLQRLAERLAADAAVQFAGGEDRAWLQRRLEQARRQKQQVRLRVSVPGQPVQELEVVPTNVAGRWLRVTDPEGEVERTLPLEAVELLG